ncbi:MAG: peptide chain release factor aRF-1 [Candidatus Brockarchaeota archaeon]|nr:peptide chain release factor aRF-1 [Candidatus Brockarchaeota archaeon]
MPEDGSDSLKEYRLRKVLQAIAGKRGRGTELISLYIPSGRQISEAMSALREEYGKASNIKSRTTRKNVQDAISKVQQRLKLIERTPENGVVIFCGAIPRGPPGSEVIETYVVTPPKPITISYYSCDDKFYVEPLMEMIREKQTIGIIVIDNTEATLAVVTGKSVDIKGDVTSGVGGKTRKGGQSARRYERIREMELNDYYKRVASHADDVFLQEKGLTGIILAGPGQTKEQFRDGNYLNYQLQSKIIATVDTAYTGNQGVKEAMEKASEKLQDLAIMKEKKLVQDFLKEIGTDSGLAIYGERDVREALKRGNAKTVLISEAVDVYPVKITCKSCGYAEDRSLSEQELFTLEYTISNQSCPKCNANALAIEEQKSLIDEFNELANDTGAKLEVISDKTEEGLMLYKSFGGVVAILRHA